MRILRISLNNIASLAGTHSIDFTREPLRSAGLFGISGPTGAGKSSLLDAVCLALFDTTPRLKQVGHLEEIVSGEKQNNSRTLLRRGTSSGFAEVAFVGVDTQTWTARWSVRRSRNHVDGKLHAAEMALFRGNVLPGQAGPVEAGGKKTLVQEAIIEKLGLTFDQFTRAVLLAQNEFAAFLKASDRERAAILQTLTGTEQFESISRAVFIRCSEERQQLETLRTRLAGNAPLSAEERSDAEATREAAADVVRQTEAKQRTCELHAAWFNLQKLRHQEVTQATEQLSAAQTAREQTTARRLDLEQTEFAIREASVFWQAQQDALCSSQTAQTSVAAATEHRLTQSRLLTQCREQLDAARRELEQISTEQVAIQPLRRTARQMDARLEPIQQRSTRAAESLDAARAADEAAATALSVATTQRDLLRKDQRQIQRKRKKLAAVAPFASESTKWVHLLREAISAETEATDAAKKLLNCEHRRALQQEQSVAARMSTEHAEELWKTARQQLQKAESVENESNAGQLAERRCQCDEEFLLLTNLNQELDRYIQRREQALSLAAELAEQVEAQTAESATLRGLTEQRVPHADRDLETATRQLRLIEAAVDDHAKRLRASIQDGEPCPVCGSQEHPYHEHAPDAETAGVHAAKRHVDDLKRRRDTLKKGQQRQELSIEARSTQIGKQQEQYTNLSQVIEDIAFSNADSPIVTSVLTVDPEKWQEAAQEQLTNAEKSRNQLALEEQAYRQAIEDTRTRRAEEEESRKCCDIRRQEQAACDRELAAVNLEFAAADTLSRTTDRRRKNTTVGLGKLWSLLPNAKNQFETDPKLFCQTFETSTKEYGRIEEELAALTSGIETQDAQIGPLEEAALRSSCALAACESDHNVAVRAQTELLEQRQQLLDGRAADEVEVELANRLTAAEAAAESAAVAYHQADKERQAAHQQLEAATNSRSRAVATLQSTECQLSAWIDRFADQYSRPLTIGELQIMLDRNEAWIRAERQQLKQLDDDVTRAESAWSVRSGQLQEHEKQRTTSEEEQTVMNSLVALTGELKQVKASETAAAAVLTSDDQRRDQNAALAEKLTKEEGVAAPWLKLNELIGSKEGDKFRMIAQRRTLDVLLSYANNQLGQLAARYRLERLPESLNLIVIDEHMGDERRSVHSLSGGESFLVSLSLALGLASLTSGRMRIESLFIDEGFGSLDPETLNTAMSALMHLEAQGRKVGVISHVTEMTDAIPVQVQVVKRRGGASKIVIPGAAVDLTASVMTAGPSPLSQGRPTSDGDTIAAQIIEILQRERRVGKGKVSIRALRQELGCDAPEFRAAQKMLNGHVDLEGRSLRLA